ncbi:SLC13 family permease [Fulvivirga lutimaris]|uniref:SLC13 family permease n=1 Tax=Fulvivirga lutimaris TaxID=1819566 RepID=UPI0012BCD49D|nr:SLC13 family permease [Fulvivirga lutimaris]MTI41703.1 SLC13/DASS family transporter [Fulvivirga lutimaris]
MHRIIGFILGPSLFILLQASGFNEPIYDVIGLAIWMIAWWVTEAVPIPVAALLPIIILPLTGIFTVSQATAPYASPIIFLFMGGFLIALGLEKHGLHLRLALSLLKITGSSGNGIILGFMIASALLSMWISNTATAVMMLPIASSVVALLSSKQGLNKNFALALMLSIAYSANIGGTITLIGTPPNVVMAGYLNQLLDFQMGFAEWLMIGIPSGLLLLTITYFLLTRVLFANNIKHVEGSSELIGAELKKLGKISKEEKLVITVFLITALGWILKPQINDLIGKPLLTDHVTAMIGGVLMFSMPVNLKDQNFLMRWEDTSKLPWGILLLFGGGMALANALAEVGIIEMIGEFVSSITEVQPLVFILVITLIVLLMTEVMSNVALVTILIPVIIGVANGINLNPLLLIIPATLSSSCAFMMPISTPPNAIVFSSGHITMKDMMKAGVWLNLIAVIVIAFLSYWIVPFIIQ